ncbi:MAG: glucose-1-phosphate cytidylyltransferase [Gemmatimonadales bacterium]|nr:glucose-1-phosphate cytidylyltransferase [Gemmatimonadales bacterium]
MKTLILAGGLGTRLAEETVVRPKPMVEIGERPILWHLMRYFDAFGFRHFILALGYKGEVVKEYFLNYYALNNSLTIELRGGRTTVHGGDVPDWTVDLVDTGLHTQTGGRVRRAQPWVGGTTFLATYGDGLSDVDLHALVAFHRAHGKLATLTAVRPPSRFGSMTFDGDRVAAFLEKPQTGEGWINGGFFVFEPGVFDYIEGDDTILERGPLERLAADGQLMAFRHGGFFQPMDTIREKLVLQQLWESGRAPWAPRT